MGRADTHRLPSGSSGAGASVQAGLRGAAVCRFVAVAACVPWRAGASVVVDTIYAGGAVCTGATGTLVDVGLAAQSCEAWSAVAQSEVTLDHTMTTYAKQKAIKDTFLTYNIISNTNFQSERIKCITIGTLQRGTFIHFLLTVESSVSRWTLTYVIMPIVPLSALATVKTRRICTGQHLVFTVCPFKPLWAHTLIAILRVLQGEKKDIKFI